MQEEEILSLDFGLELPSVLVQMVDRKGTKYILIRSYLG